MEWLLVNSLKIKLCRWCPGALGSRTSAVILCQNFHFQVAKAILFLFRQWISKFKCFTLHDTVTTYFIKCLVIISIWSERQNNSGGTIHKKRESIIKPLMELTIDHRDIAVL